jgi:hypothetical protein
MNTKIEAAIERLGDDELKCLWCAYGDRFMMMPAECPDNLDDLVAVYAVWCFLQRQPAVFVKASPLSGMVRLVVAVHSPQLLPGLIQTATEAGVAIRRVMPVNGIFTGSVTADSALAVAQMLGDPW